MLVNLRLGNVYFECNSVINFTTTGSQCSELLIHQLDCFSTIQDCWLVLQSLIFHWNLIYSGHFHPVVKRVRKQFPKLCLSYYAFPSVEVGFTCGLPNSEFPRYGSPCTRGSFVSLSNHTEIIPSQRVTCLQYFVLRHCSSSFFSSSPSPLRCNRVRCAPSRGQNLLPCPVLPDLRSVGHRTHTGTFPAC